MEAFMISLVIVLAVTVVGGPLGWGIVLTAVLYLVFETVSTNIQKSQKQMREEMDMILSKNTETQEQAEKALLADVEEPDEVESGEVEVDEIDEIPIEPQDQPIRRGGTDNAKPPAEESSLEEVEDSPQEEDEPNTEDGIVGRVDAAANVLDALEERDKTNS